jgi:aromatic ring hydroxylase
MMEHAVDGQSPLAGVPTTPDELRQKVDLVHQSGMMSHVTYTSIMTLATVVGRIKDNAPKYVEPIQQFIEDAQKRDIRITQCITDAKGDRSRPPGKQEDPDAYVHVVDRQKDGVVIRGAKLHITGASLGHELMTIPTKAMKAGEEDYAIAAMVPGPTTTPRASSSSTTSSSRTSASSSTARHRRHRCSPTPSACGSASAACRPSLTGPMCWSAWPSSSPRPTAWPARPTSRRRSPR